MDGTRGAEARAAVPPAAPMPSSLSASSPPRNPADALLARGEVYETIPAWLAARQRGIGSSEAATVIGLPQAGSPLRLYYEKTGQIDTVADPSPALRIGLLMEPLILRLFGEEAADHGVGDLRLAGEGERHVLLRHPDHPWMLASLDAVGLRGEEPVIVELKTVSAWAGRDWLDHGEPPVPYQVQVQHQLAVTGLQRAYLVALIGGFDLRWTPVERDEAFIARLIEAEAAFWRRVEQGEPPEADDKPETQEAMKRLLLKQDRATIPVAVPLQDLDEERQRVIEQIQGLETRKVAIENIILSKVIEQGGTMAVLPNGVTYEWRKVTRKPYRVEGTTYVRLTRREPKP